MRLATMHDAYCDYCRILHIHYPIAVIGISLYMDYCVHAGNVKPVKVEKVKILKKRSAIIDLTDEPVAGACML